MECPQRNKFFFVCGLFTPKSKQRTFTPLLIAKFCSFFKSEYKCDQWYAPSIVCLTCERELAGGPKSSIRYSQPTLWLERATHIKDSCYFCVTFLRTDGYRYKTREKISCMTNLDVIPAVKRLKCEILCRL